MQDLTDELAALRRRLDQAQGFLKVEELRARQPQLEAEMSRPDLWDDAELARQIQTELTGVNDDLATYDGLALRIDDAETLHELAREESDDSLEPEVLELIAAIRRGFDAVELRALYTGEYDQLDAVCHVQSGEGGTDAQDWAEMLLRMYRRWAERDGLDLDVLSVNAGTEAGISSADFMVKGRYAYGQLRAEHGVHRLVRMSPFNKDGKRQTAFASLHVSPFFEEVTSEVDIDEGDLRIDTYRSSGAGGQHVNVTDSAVRITHLPTGIVVSCQNERSQHQNKDRAMQMLASRLLELEREKREDALAAITGKSAKVGFGSQIRSYVLAPYQMVKDLRSEHETSAVDAVLDGDIDQFIEAYLRWVASES